MSGALPPLWAELVRRVNSQPGLFGAIGVRDPDNPCEGFDGQGFDEGGKCMSDGHYLCTECSQLSPEAPRFEENYGWAGIIDRLEALADTLAMRERGDQARRLYA